MITKTAKILIASEAQEPLSAFSSVKSLAGKMAFPALNAAFATYGVASGNQSVGEATGEALGGWLGYELGSNIANKYWNDTKIQGYKFKPTRWAAKLARNPFIGLPMGTAIIGSSWLGNKLNSILPWRRQAPAQNTNNQQVTY